MKRFFKHLIGYALILIGITWVLGFVAFVIYAISFKFLPDKPTEAIVVLTGGSDRLNTALGLLKIRADNKLLISGVNKKVSPTDIFGDLDENLLNQITFGYLAENTRENAQETVMWIRRHQIKTILLVTSFYHMPRSIFEIQKLEPEITIVPHPVFPKSFDDSVDWIKTRYAWLLCVEYHKYLMTNFKQYILKGF